MAARTGAHERVSISQHGQKGISGTCPGSAGHRQRDTHRQKGQTETQRKRKKEGEEKETDRNKDRSRRERETER